MVPPRYQENVATLMADELCGLYNVTFWWYGVDASGDALAKICRCSQLVKRAAIILSAAASSWQHDHTQTDTDTPATTHVDDEPGRQVVEAADQLCHVIEGHLSRGRDVTTPGRRMLPIVPGTATLRRGQQGRYSLTL